MARSKNSFSKLPKYIQMVGKCYSAATKQFGIRETEHIKDEITKRTPVDTGRLRAAFHSEPPKIENNTIILTVTNNVEYAEYVEYGHRWATDSHGHFLKLEDPNATNFGFTNGRFMARDGLAASESGRTDRYSTILNKALDKLSGIFGDK